MRHDDSTDHAQSLLYGFIGAVFAPWNHCTFEYGQLVRTSIDVLYCAYLLILVCTCNSENKHELKLTIHPNITHMIVMSMPKNASRYRSPDCMQRTKIYN